MEADLHVFQIDLIRMNALHIFERIHFTTETKLRFIFTVFHECQERFVKIDDSRMTSRATTL